MTSESTTAPARGLGQWERRALLKQFARANGARGPSAKQFVRRPIRARGLKLFLGRPMGRGERRRDMVKQIVTHPPNIGFCLARKTLANLLCWPPLRTCAPPIHLSISVVTPQCEKFVWRKKFTSLCVENSICSNLSLKWQENQVGLLSFPRGTRNGGRSFARSYLHMWETQRYVSARQKPPSRNGGG